MIKLRFSPRFSGSFRKNAAGNEEKEIPYGHAVCPSIYRLFRLARGFRAGWPFYGHVRALLLTLFPRFLESGTFFKKGCVKTEPVSAPSFFFARRASAATLTLKPMRRHVS